MKAAAPSMDCLWLEMVKSSHLNGENQVSFRSKQSKSDQEYNSHKETSAVQLNSLYKVSSYPDRCAMGL